MTKNVPRQNSKERVAVMPARRQGGYSMAELMVVVAIIGILVASSAPFFVSYYQAAKLKSAAEDIAGYLNQGRQLAIRTNNPVCVQVTATTMSYRLGSCAGTIWVGAGTTGAGSINLPQGITITASANPVFSYLGAAAPAATYTVTNTDTGLTLTVTLAASGRISIGP
jgi:prepilin-type N-terminal cleavage/methylation domain-containing protein